MTIDNDDLMNSVIASLGRINPIPLEDMPNIDLYMDQLTTFMSERLKRTTRHPDVDKVLTKTMINNYAKNDLLPPPVRKKYSKDHLILLIFIYYYKNLLSINDIQTLITPLKERFHVSDDELNLSKVYNTAFELQNEELQPLIEDLKEKYDVYIKKLLIEKILDNITDKELAEKNKEKAKAKEEKLKKKNQ